MMCNTDTNVEYCVVREDGIRETLDWDVKRCRNIDAALILTPKWRAFDGEIPGTKHEITDFDILSDRVVTCQLSVLPN